MRVTSTKTKNSESFYITHSFINENGKVHLKFIKIILFLLIAGHKMEM